MSKHWNPRVISGARRKAPRGWRLASGDIRLAALGGVLAGLVYASAHTGAPVLVRVVDGDTFDYDGQRIRIADIDAPEVRGRCAYESELAARATQRMGELLHAGAFEMEPLAGRDVDQFGRKLRVITRDGQSLGDQLVAEGLARTWTGRREPWC